MSWDKVKLSEVAEVIAGQSPESKYYNSTGIGMPFFQGKADFGVKFPTVRYWTTKQTKVAEPLDILFSVRAPVGPTNICNIKSCIGRGLAAIRVGENLDYRYLRYYLKFIEHLIANEGNGSTFSAITTSVLKDLQIPLPPLPVQKRIAEILDAAAALKRKDQELLRKYDELAQAIFIDMFGDPVRNEKGWPLVSLSDYGTFKNGLNFNSGDTGRVIKYLSVRDFKSKYKIDDIEKLTSIELNTLPNDDYLLKNGDIVFVRSNGNKALVGRCVEVFPDQASVTFSGFCIRYRLSSNGLLSSFLAQLFRNSSFKSLMLGGGRGANIQNINQGILSEIKVPKPDLAKQQHFVKIIEGLELQKITLERQIQKSENLFNSLIQKGFNGELGA